MARAVLLYRISHQFSGRLPPHDMEVGLPVGHEMRDLDALDLVCKKYDYPGS